MCHFAARSFSMARSFSASGSWVPIVDTEPLVFGQAIGYIGVKAVFIIGWRVFPVRCLTKGGIWHCSRASVWFHDFLSTSVALVLVEIQRIRDEACC